jgi:phosphatidylserine/phosphatidylglycerophosphate/cardiolipin synthase-like enzyme
MSTREQRRNKWFIDLSSDDSSLPPKRRYPGSEVEDWNSATVHSLLEGAEYMQEWYSAISDIMSDSWQIYHAGWNIGNVPTLGKGKSDTKALDLLNHINSLGNDVYVAVGGQLPTKEKNEASIDTLEFETAAIDSRYPSFGSNHMKYTLFRSANENVGLVGSIDLNRSRWGDKPHKPNDPELRFRGPRHDLGVKLTGTVFQDILRGFQERWNDKTRDDWKIPGQDVQKQFNDLKKLMDDRRVDAPDHWTMKSLAGGTPLTTPPKVHTATSWPVEGDQKHDIQVLRTFGQSAYHGYSWSDKGEFTIWASYLNAIKSADKYIYIEDPYFLPFASPSNGFDLRDGLWCYSDMQSKDVTPFYQLKEALNCDVDVIVITNLGRHPDMMWSHAGGVKYLYEHAKTAQGDFKIARLNNGNQRIKLHSKLMIVDDEATFIGSANFSRRSFTNDGELQLAVVDGNDDFASMARESLWSEHLRSQVAPSIDNALSTFKSGIENEQGYLVDHSSIIERPFRFGDGRGQIEWVDPYGGPPLNHT